MKSSVALVGFMGTGKTAVGRALGERLGKEFVEMDALIERHAGKPIPRIFLENGEVGFREIEIEVTKQAAARQSAVIACGGGIILNRINIDRLKENCVIVLLTASPAVILKRVTNDLTARPVLKAYSLEYVKNLLAFRRPFYERAADLWINTSRLTVPGVVRRIVDKLDNESNNNPK